MTLFVTLPLLCVIIILIKIETPGPVFFLQDRVGLNGQTFKMYKFRKFMHGSVGGPNVTLVKDPRLTKMGKILERFKLDELPQFVNVLMGNMSIVGPRPETPNFVKYFSPENLKVLKVKPGIFGVNQLIYRREADLFPKNADPETYYISHLMPEKLKNDIAYINKATVLSDAVITVRCAFVVIVEPFISKFRLILRNRRGRVVIIENVSEDSLTENKTVIVK